MTTKGMYKLDDGNCRPTNCFPARSLLRPKYEEGAGHWQVARQTAEKTKIELLLNAKASRIKWRGLPQPTDTQRHAHEKILDGVQLMTLHHVRSPSHLCSVDISNQNFGSAKEEDFEQFDSVAYVNATENLLTLEVFRTFPGLRELELSLNGLRNLKVSAGDFPHLEVLDLSYNNLSPEDVQTLGVLSHLKVLHLTANGLRSLPLDLAIPDSESHPRFSALEVLLLDDNHLSHPNVFVSLANLRSLKQLNLDKNGIKEVPYLHCSNNSQFSIHPLSAKSGIREGLRSRKSAGKHLRQNQSGLDKQPDYIILPNSKDPDRTEIIFPSPDPVTQENSPSSGFTSHCETSTSFSQEFTLPLPELRFLSLANNQIEHEEDLLAVALFPSLTELTFHGNPFTISRSGDPPLLSSFLQNKLGIKLVRKKISKLEKPRIFIPVRANRKVKSQLPKIRKRPLMLEAPQEAAFWELWTGAEVDFDNIMHLDEPEPLPPIRTFSAEKIDRAELSEQAQFTPISIVTSCSLEDVLGTVPSTGTVPMAQPSLDQILSAGGPLLQTSVEQILSAAESVASGKLFVAEQTQLGLAESARSLLIEEVLSEPLAQEENLSEAGPPGEIAAADQDQVEPPLPPNSPLPEQGPEKHVSAAGLPAAEQEPDFISSPGQQDHLQPLEPPSAPLQEQDLPQPEAPTSPPPIEKQHLSQTDLSTGPFLDAPDQQDQVPTGPLPEASDQQEHGPTGPVLDAPDQQEHLPAGPVPDAPDQQEQVPTGHVPDAPDQQEHLPAGPDPDAPDQLEHGPTGPVLDAPDQQEHLPAGPVPDAPDQQEQVPTGPVPDAPDQQEHLPAGPDPDAPDQQEQVPTGPVLDAPDQQEHLPAGPDPDAPDQLEHGPTGPVLDAPDQQEYLPAGPVPDAPDQQEQVPAGPVLDAPDQQEHLPAGPDPDAPDQLEHGPTGPVLDAPDQQEHLPAGSVPDAPDQQEHIPTGPVLDASDQGHHLPAGIVLDVPDQQEHLPAGRLPDAQEQAALPSLPSQAEVLLEPLSPTRLPTEEQDLPEILPDNRLPSAEPDQLESVPLPSSPLQERDLPGPVPPTGSPAEEQNMAEQNLSGTSPLPEPPPEVQVSSEPIIPPAIPTLQEPSQPEHEPAISSVPWQSSWTRPTSASSMSQSVESSEPAAPFTASAKTPEKLLRLHSSSRDLYLLLSQAHQTLLEGSEERSSDFELFGSSSSSSSSIESLESRKSESFFMTQVVEPSSSHLRKETPKLQQPSGVRIVEPWVPEKYKGYEELLDSHTDKDQDFIEPVGIQQNVKALKKALRYPLVYRESKARLDSLQKRFVPMEKKVLRIPPPQPQQTKEQKLEEILHKMRTPTNIFEVPLVCVLRKRKSNWREYREALALLKEFQQEYKATVAACGMGSESRIIGRIIGQAGSSQSQTVGDPGKLDLAGIQASQQQLEESPSPMTEEDEGL